MRKSRPTGRLAIWRLLAVATLVVTALIAWVSVPADAATSFADPAFQQQWSMGEAITPNFWGPLTLAQDGRSEMYTEATGGMRLVQYFDKARMEKKNDGGVTNGLLATELITGRLQLGDNTFSQGSPAGIPVAGDPDNLGPTYASINVNKTTLLDLTGSATGTPATKALQTNGTFGSFTNAMSDANTVIAAFDSTTGHNVPKAFTDYRNKAGLLTIGLAISEPFWSNVKVANVQKDVLIQAFERRILTYTASNQPAFQVEFGNIGQHYYTWRYQSPGALNTPTPSISPATGTAIAQATGTAIAASATPATTVDTAPPKITRAPTIPYTTPNSFAVLWGTNEPASSELLFGTTDNYEQQNLNLKAVYEVDHQVIIRNLTAGATYHYRVQSRDPSGNFIRDDQDRTVTLPAVGAVPKVTNIAISKKTATTFTVTWTTDTASMSRIEYGNAEFPTSGSGEGYSRYRTGDNNDPSGTGHNATAISLEPNKTYRFRIVAVAGTNGATSSASDEGPSPSTLNSALTNSEVTALKINDLKVTQDKATKPVVFAFGTDRNASIAIEIGLTSKLGGGTFYSSSDDPQALHDYTYPLSRSLHSLSITLLPGSYYYRIYAYDEQGTATSETKTITVT